MPFPPADQSRSRTKHEADPGGRKAPCDYLLLDTWQKDSYGGSGKTFDRSLIPPLAKPWFLAGGLNTENIAESIAQCHPWAVDVSSAVETNSVKDKEKIKTFIDHVRR